MQQGSPLLAPNALLSQGVGSPSPMPPGLLLNGMPGSLLPPCSGTPADPATAERRRLEFGTPAGMPLALLHCSQARTDDHWIPLEGCSGVQ